MEVENMIDRPGCEVLRHLFQAQMDTRREWDRGYIRGALGAVMLSGFVSMEEHRALSTFFGVAQ